MCWFQSSNPVSGTTRTGYVYWMHTLRAGGCSLGLFALGRWMLSLQIYSVYIGSIKIPSWNENQPVNFCNISNLLLTTMSLLAISVKLVLLDNNLSWRLPFVIYEYSFLCLWSGVFLFSVGLYWHCWVNRKLIIFSIITFRPPPFLRDVQ